MSPSVVSVISPGLTEAQRNALISLLADDDPAVYQVVRQKLLSFGEAARDWLRPHLLSNEATLRRHAHEIIDRLDRQAADIQFLAFCLSKGEDLDAEEGSWLLARTRYPDVNPAGYQALLDSYAGDLLERIDFGAAPDQILATINRYFFEELSFSGNEQNYYEPDNSYLNRVVDRRLGNPVSLCLIFLFITRRLRLPVTGIGTQGPFICRFQTSKEELYIDVFNKGRLLTKGECLKFLPQASRGFQDGYLTPTTPRRTLLRLCSDLHQIYVHLNDREESERLQRYIIALAK